METTTNDSSRPDNSNNPSMALLAVLITVATLTIVLTGPAAAQGPSLSCVGTSGGAASLIDSWLTVYENDSAIVDGTFNDSNTVDFGEVALSAPGTGAARLETDAATQTCSGNNDASSIFPLLV